MIDTNNLLTAGEVAKKLKVTVQSVRLLIKNGMLNAERVGNQWLTSIEDLNEYIEKYERLRKHRLLRGILGIISRLSQKVKK